VCAQQRASIVGERLNADLCFPGQEGLQGDGALLTIIDEASRFAFVFPLVRKADTPEELIERSCDRSGRAAKCKHCALIVGVSSCQINLQIGLQSMASSMS
jgi:hypothetical protein